eukprot:TRINITY_DN7940_c0_g1_i8.p1 TRINITY_DN7940_c0_g1~~TRINITY_DN7940_c0_g1_i8.p1  ORF type:complete len:376 (+),score=62.89 TRINITY_DN7940_c0_g1_i8:61-1188(+)
MGVALGWILYKEAGFDSVSLSLVVAVPFASLFVCGCYWMAYCLVGRVESKQRPTRHNGYEWPWDFHCSFLGLIFLFLVFGMYGLIVPAFSGGGTAETTVVVIHCVLFGSAMLLLIKIETTDPAIVPSVRESTAPNSAKHQRCMMCSERMNAGLDGPWTGVIDRQQAATGSCFYKEQRRYHCSRCNRCVAGLDHHCRFLNQCVSDVTYAPWFAFMVVLWLAVFLQFCLTIVMIGFWVAGCDTGCNTGDLTELDSTADFYSHGLYWTLMSIQLVFQIGLLAFVGKLVHLHINLLLKSRGKPNRYTMFEHLRDHPPRGADPNKWEAKFQWKSDHEDVRLPPAKEALMRQALQHAQKTSGYPGADRNNNDNDTVGSCSS